MVLETLVHKVHRVIPVQREPLAELVILVHRVHRVQLDRLVRLVLDLPLLLAVD